MKRVLLIVLSIAVFAAVAMAGDDESESKVLQFHTMVGLTGPYVGAANPIRGIAGAGLPWAIGPVNGKLDDDGRLQLSVRGLVLVARGTNPLATFRAIVSCQSIDNAGAASVVNVSTAAFPATTAGDALVRTTLQLPHPCIAPIVFVTTAGGQWIAATGFSSDEDRDHR